MDSSKFAEVSLSKVTLYTGSTTKAQRQGVVGRSISPFCCESGEHALFSGT